VIDGHCIAHLVRDTMSVLSFVALDDQSWEAAWNWDGIVASVDEYNDALQEIATLADNSADKALRIRHGTVTGEGTVVVPAMAGILSLEIAGLRAPAVDVTWKAEGGPIRFERLDVPGNLAVTTTGRASLELVGSRVGSVALVAPGGGNFTLGHAVSGDDGALSCAGTLSCVLSEERDARVRIGRLDAGAIEITAMPRTSEGPPDKRWDLTLLRPSEIAARSLTIDGGAWDDIELRGLKTTEAVIVRSALVRERLDLQGVVAPLVQVLDSAISDVDLGEVASEHLWIARCDIDELHGSSTKVAGTIALDRVKVATALWLSGLRPAASLSLTRSTIDGPFAIDVVADEGVGTPILAQGAPTRAACALEFGPTRAGQDEHEVDVGAETANLAPVMAVGVGGCQVRSDAAVRITRSEAASIAIHVEQTTIDAPMAVGGVGVPVTFLATESTFREPTQLWCSGASKIEDASFEKASEIFLALESSLSLDGTRFLEQARIQGPSGAATPKAPVLASVRRLWFSEMHISYVNLERTPLRGLPLDSLRIGAGTGFRLEAPRLGTRRLVLQDELARAESGPTPSDRELADAYRRLRLGMEGSSNSRLSSDFHVGELRARGRSTDSGLAERALILAYAVFGGWGARPWRPAAWLGALLLATGALVAAGGASPQGPVSPVSTTFTVGAEPSTTLLGSQFTVPVATMFAPAAPDTTGRITLRPVGRERPGDYVLGSWAPWAVATNALLSWGRAQTGVTYSDAFSVYLVWARLIALLLAGMTAFGLRSKVQR
jgi:hypothetical protein